MTVASLGSSCRLIKGTGGRQARAAILSARPTPCSLRHQPQLQGLGSVQLFNGGICFKRHQTRHIPEVAYASTDVGFGSSDNIQKEANGLRRIGWVSFWLQLALSIVSAIVLFFTATTASRGAFPQLPVFFNLAGVVTGFISTFLAYGKTRLARRVIVNGEKVSKAKVAAGVLGTTYLNLAGMGATLVGLQSTVGGLVGKALTSSSAGAYNLNAASTAPAALDVFAVQASTNTILLHFIAILFANWTLRVLNKDAKSPAPSTA